MCELYNRSIWYGGTDVCTVVSLVVAWCFSLYQEIFAIESTKYMVYLDLLVCIRIQTSNSNSQPIWLEVSVRISKFPGKVFSINKITIHILTIFISGAYVFRRVMSDLFKNNLITFICTLSPTAENDQLYVLTCINYCKNNPLHIRQILVVYQSQLTSIGHTFSNKGTGFIKQAQIKA